MTLLGLWADRDTVSMALLDEEPFCLGIITLECPDGRFSSVGAVHPPAIRLERAVRDLYGLEPQGLPDRRPWLDHGRWEVQHPLGAEPNALPATAPYAFLPVEGESLHQIPVGPVHAGIIEPGHFRFTANGETVVRLEQRLGYVHKGIDSLMLGADLERGARLAGTHLRRQHGRVCAGVRACGRSGARNHGSAAGRMVAGPDGRARAPRQSFRRFRRHLQRCVVLDHACPNRNPARAHVAGRSRLFRSPADDGWHRSGRRRDRSGPRWSRADRAACSPRSTARFPKLVELYDNTASLQDRTVATGILKPALARRFGAGGFVGRASGRAFDARRAIKYPPYDALAFDVPMLEAGDVNARVWIRIREIEQSLGLIKQILAGLPAGPLRVRAEPEKACEGLGFAEGFRGDILAWLRLGDDGRIARCHLRDPSWFQWPLLEAAIEGNIVADFPLCNKSFNCSYSGHDL